MKRFKLYHLVLLLFILGTTSLMLAVLSLHNSSYKYVFWILGVALLSTCIWLRYYRSFQIEKLLAKQLQKTQKDLTILRQERDQLSAILSGMREGLIVTDPQGIITMSNPAFYREFQLEKRCEGKSLLETLLNPEVHDVLQRALNEQKIQEEEILFRLSHGKTFDAQDFKKPSEKYSLVYCSPLLEGEKSTGAILVFFDVTQIRHLERIRKDFVANVSHELKTPLTSIRGFAETLLSGALNDHEAAKRFLTKIEKNAADLQNLIEDLLRLSEIESGRRPLHPVSLEVAPLLNESKQHFAEILGSKDIELHLNIEPEIKALVEGAALKQILTNLIENAIKYSNPQGAITLSAQATSKPTPNNSPKKQIEELGSKLPRSSDPQGKGLSPSVRSPGGEPPRRRSLWIEISVSDTGMGIPAKDLPHIFERFYRVDKARSRDLGGTGLGLAIVKHLVQTHGGEIQVTSTEGQGSCFTFTLPAA